jgi:hypothetical protein
MPLSVFCMTRGPGARVAAQLAFLRPVADELLVAVDDRAEQEDVDTFAAIADRIVLFPYREPVDRPLPWLHRECSGDWVLMIDDDEVPSPSLVRVLPQLVVADDVTHYRLRRRWLFPDAEHWIDQAPWSLDYSARLVLNDERLLSFPVETHQPIDVLGPSRYVEEPLYHLDCVINSIESRRRKAQRYERLWPGKRLAGLALNHGHYLPELVPDLRVVEVPDQDSAAIAGVLEAEAPQRPATPAEPSPVHASEIDRLWAGRRIGHAARVEIVGDLTGMHAGEARPVDVRVENLGKDVWPWGWHGLPAVRLASRWPELEGSQVVRTPLPGPVGPGESAIVPVAVAAPEKPGRYRVEIDLVHEHVRWFGVAATAEVDVRPLRRVAIVGDVGPFREPGDEAMLRAELERLAETEPTVAPVILARDASVPTALTPAATAPSAHDYLLGGLGGGRVLPAVHLAARSARLLRAARRVARGEAAGKLPREGDRFLRTLVGAERLIVVGTAPLDERLPARELAPHVLAIRTAGVLGIPVEIRSQQGVAARPVLRKLVPRLRSASEPAPAKTARARQ